MIGLREMRFIIAVEKFGSITDAARHLYVPQPTISNALKRVEEELNQVLFYRTATGMEITSNGKRFTDLAKQIISLDEKIYSDISTDDQKGILFRIGVSSYSGECLLPQVLLKVKKEYPDVVFDLVVKTSSVLEEMLKADDLDLSILSQPRSLTGLDYELLCKDDILLALPPSHGIDLAKYRTHSGYINLPVKELENLSYILPEKGHAVRDFVDIYFKKNNIRQKISAVCSNLNLTHSLVANDIGAGFVPHRYVEHHASDTGPVYCSVKEMIPEWPIIIIKNKMQSPIAERIIELLKESCDIGE